MAGAIDDPIYHARGLRKVYGKRCVLDVEALEVRRGEVLAIIGPNGAGKSTLLRLLNFLEPASSGDLTFLGQKAKYPVPLAMRRQVTMVFQRPILLHGSVWQNVAYPLRIRKIKVGASIDDMLGKLELSALSETSVHELSGGEFQRVALARALVLRPRVLLLDEPAANLDPQNVEKIEAIIRTIRREGHTTVVLVTHRVEQARRLADRTALLIDGSFIEIAETTRFFTQPEYPRAAAFVQGQMIY